MNRTDVSVDRRFAFVESLTGDEARMFATYVAGLDARVFAEAASLVERDRAAFGRTGVEHASAPVPRGVTALYDWADTGDFPTEATPRQDVDEAHQGEADTVGYVPGSLPAELTRQAAARFLADVVTGTLPGVRRIKAELGVGQDKAQQVRAYLATLANA